MKQTINESQFIQAFDEMNRGNNFSYEGRQALYDYLVDFEDSCETELELDVIAICCDYNEYENLEEFQKDYNAEDYKSIEDIEGDTTVISVDEDRFIIQAF